MEINKYLKVLGKKLFKKYPNCKIPKSLIDKLDFKIEQDSVTKLVPHKTVLVYDDNIKLTIAIDENIAELIKYIWMAGISTISSCEDNVPIGYVWILFQSSNDLNRFLNIVFIGTEFGGSNTYFSGDEIKKNWIYTCSIDTFPIEEDNIKDIEISMSLRFPRSDYKWVLKRFKQYFKKK